ncbi:MAG: ABC transporter ATP-binding protein [[Candidatus Thermochlorobacteriaceae] bacterium GBChlB]|nr:MAG: ABC transporter ATP-binding protein [[Candidatus Thermochlorobacteriaceae] bacterium GBChlB]
MFESLFPFLKKPASPARKGDNGKVPTLKENLAALKQLPKFFKLVWQTSPSMVSLDVLIRLFRATVPLATLYAAKLITDEIVRLTQTSGDKDVAFLWQIVAAQFAITILSDALGRANALVNSLLGDRVANKISLQLMQHASTLDLERFEDAEFYNKLERARQQTASRISLMSEVMGQLQQLVTIVALAIGLVVFNPWLLLLLVVALVPAFLGETHFNGQSYSLLYSYTPEKRELDYIRYTGASDETAKEVKVFGLSEFLIARYKDLSEKFFDKNRALAIRRASWGAVFSMVGNAGYTLAYAVMIERTLSGGISIGDLGFLAGSFANLRALLESLLSRFSSIAESALYLKDLFDFFDLKPRIVAPPNPIAVPKPMRDGFVFENVGFKYPNSERWAVRHLSFHLNVGEKLALVGENGAGKTTLVKLLARLYEPTEGRILLDGHDVRDYHPEDLRKEIGVIFQDFIRYHFTAGNNIAVGQIDARDDAARIEYAAEKSLADSVVKKLPKGYEQLVGKRFDGGVDLSGGEWQKIALARAYMREAQLLILDEPTAALDARAEHEVFQRFAELTSGKTAVLISHRFSTVRMADRILVLENGELLEIGSHAELLTKNGRYAELFKLQARGYQ